jgi:6-phosphogluconate dehydrogenase
MVKSPCTKDCEKRNETCHCECQAYKDFVEKREEEKKLIKASKEYYTSHTKFVIDQRTTWHRQHR